MHRLKVSYVSCSIWTWVHGHSHHLPVMPAWKQCKRPACYTALIGSHIIGNILNDFGWPSMYEVKVTESKQKMQRLPISQRQTTRQCVYWAALLRPWPMTRIPVQLDLVCMRTVGFGGISCELERTTEIKCTRTLLSFSPSRGCSILRSAWNPALILCIRRRSLLLAISRRALRSLSRGT